MKKLLQLFFILGTVNLSTAQNNAKPGTIFINDCFPEELIGTTWFDLQTNNSIGNWIVNNYDGTISLGYNFSPDNNQGPPLMPNRGAGYNYFDGSIWEFQYPGFPFPTGGGGEFPNIVVTPSGKEMLIAQSRFGNSDSTSITVRWHPNKGALIWDTLMYPWGTNTLFALPKACGGLTNENVYVIFQGSNSITSGNSLTNTFHGLYGQLYFSRSIDGGLTWSPATLISLIDSTNYKGFTGDSYSIDAIGDTVAISFGNEFTDVGLLKSTDAGQTWTKYIIQQHPQPMYDLFADTLSDLNQDGIADTIYSNGGDSKVLIDNDGMCHVWFSSLSYINDTTGDGLFTPNYSTDALNYWNETMPQNNGYVSIAGALDINGNGVLDVPTDQTCSLRWGNYGGGITQMPSAGIDPAGNIFLSYQSIDESADTGFYHQAHRHVYIKVLPQVGGTYDPANWSVSFDIVPDTTYICLGDGYNQEAAYADVCRRVNGPNLYIMYLRDNAPGHALSASGTCDAANNVNPADIVVSRIDIATLLLVLNNKSENLEAFYVGQNYPNPTFDIANIDISLVNSEDVLIELVDLAGRKVSSKSIEKMPSGKNTVQLNTSALESGIYTYSVIINNMRITRKMIIQK